MYWSSSDSVAFFFMLRMSEKTYGGSILFRTMLREYSEFLSITRLPLLDDLGLYFLAVSICFTGSRTSTASSISAKSALSCETTSRRWLGYVIGVTFTSVRIFSIFDR